MRQRRGTGGKNMGQGKSGEKKIRIEEEEVKRRWKEKWARKEKR